MTDLLLRNKAEVHFPIQEQNGIRDITIFLGYFKIQ